MKTMSRDNQIWRICIAALFFSSAAILLVPAAEKYALLSIVTGVLFWSGMLTGCALHFWLARRLKAREAKGRAGLLAFMSNIPAACADIGGLLCFIALILLAVFPVLGEYIYYLLLFMLLFCFYMHCVLNGRTYRLLRAGRAKPEQVPAQPAKEPAPQQPPERDPAVVQISEAAPAQKPDGGEDNVPETAQSVHAGNNETENDMQSGEGCGMETDPVEKRSDWNVKGRVKQ